MVKRITLPKEYEIGKLRLLLAKYEDKYLDELYDMLERSKTDSAGISENEFSTKHELEQLLKKVSNTLVIFDREAGDKIIGVAIMYPTPLSRSAAPLYAGTYTVVDAAYRGNFLGQVMNVVLSEVLLDNGHLGFLGRTPITSKIPMVTDATGLQLIGTIPKSVKVPSIGWVYDIVSFMDFTFRMNEHEKKQAKFRIETKPDLVENKQSITTLMPTVQLVQRKTVITKKYRPIVIRGAEASELMDVENMIRKCAQDGDGFNLDEFCPNDGQYLHKFIHKPKVVIATDLCGSIKGAAIFGFSTLSRIPGPLYTAYFIVRKQDRKKGIGTALLEYVCEMCRKQNCDMLLFDVFVNNHVAMDWLSRCGFVTLGCLPNCGYIANQGFTHSSLMFKQLSQALVNELASKL